MKNKTNLTSQAKRLAVTAPSQEPVASKSKKSVASQADSQFASAPLLGRNRETSNNPVLPLFRTIDDTNYKLTEMSDYKGMMPFIIESAKKKGMGFNVSDFADGEIESLNQHVVVFRGAAGQFINSLFQSVKN